MPSGTVYPALARAEEVGYLRGAWEKSNESDPEGVGRPRRRYYELTRAGAEALQATVKQMTALSSLQPARSKRS
jgi:PadR family transcriptional regulator